MDIIVLKLAKLKPKLMIGSHGPVVKGTEVIADILESYHDAIKYVHDQTVRSTELLYELDDIIGLSSERQNFPFVNVIC